MKQAIIIAAGFGIEGESLSAYGALNVGGVPQLKRLIVTAEKVGINNFTIIVDSNNSPLIEVISKDKDVKSNISWHTLGKPIDLEPHPYLLLQSNLTITRKGLSNFIDSRISEEEVGFLFGKSDNDSLAGGGQGVFDSEREAKEGGAFLSYGVNIEKLISNSLDISSWVSEQDPNTKPIELSSRYWINLSTDRESINKAEDLLFLEIRQSERGWKSRNINRRISIQISRLLVKTSLTPNQLSAFVGIIGVMSGVFFAFGHIVVGGILMELSSILDGCDGEVAKMKLKESKLGQWIDTIFDQLAYVSFLIGVPLGYYYIAGNRIIIVIGCINFIIYILSLLWGIYFLGKYAESGSMVTYPSTIDRLFPIEQRSLLYKLVFRIRPLIQREYFASFILIASVIGGYSLVLGITSVSLVLAAIHLFDDYLMTSRYETYDRQLVNKS